MTSVKDRHGPISCIPTNTEKYISFSIGGATFIDSFQFMASSLDNLSQNLTSYPEVEKHIKNKVCDEDLTDNDIIKLLRNLSGEFTDYREQPYREPNLNTSQEKQFNLILKLMTRKGIYPYSYFDSWDKFNEGCLPEKKEFHNNLTDTDISEEDYNHAKDVYTTMNMKTLRDYHDFYLTTDVLLLADVFETFRHTCLLNYSLDPAHFLTAPSLSWQAALKMTKVSLELLTDPDKYLFIEDGIRGGVSVITHRFAEANNKYTPTYDASKPNSYLMYWDAKNLYG